MADSQRQKLDQIMRQNLPQLLNFAVRLTGNHDRAEELVQNAMLKAIKSWSNFRHDSNPKTWLYSITVNAFRDSLRSKTNQQLQLPVEHELESSEQGPEQNLIENELNDEIAKQISNLPGRQREVLILTVFEKLSVKEISEVLNMKQPNVYTTLHHARTTLKQSLQPILETKKQNPEKRNR